MGNGSCCQKDKQQEQIYTLNMLSETENQKENQSYDQKKTLKNSNNSKNSKQESSQTQRQTKDQSQLNQNIDIQIWHNIQPCVQSDNDSNFEVENIQFKNDYFSQKNSVCSYQDLISQQSSGKLLMKNSQSQEFSNFTTFQKISSQNQIQAMNQQDQVLGQAKTNTNNRLDKNEDIIMQKKRENFQQLQKLKQEEYQKILLLKQEQEMSKRQNLQVQNFHSQPKKGVLKKSQSINSNQSFKNRENTKKQVGFSLQKEKK